MTTVRPGMWARRASRLCEGWLPQDRPRARHGGADAEPGHRGLGDRGVQQAVRPPVVQPAGEREHVPALADVDAREEHVGIILELVFERQPDGVHRPEHAAVPGPGAPAGLPPPRRPPRWPRRPPRRPAPPALRPRAAARTRTRAPWPGLVPALRG